MPNLFHSLVIDNHVNIVVIMIVMEIENFRAIWLLYNVVQASLLGLELKLHLMSTDYNEIDSQ